MIELLSPAGDEEKMRVAFNYGADAVYFGGQNYSLRANAKNFNNEEIKNAVVGVGLPGAEQPSRCQRSFAPTGHGRCRKK